MSTSATTIALRFWPTISWSSPISYEHVLHKGSSRRNLSILEHEHAMGKSGRGGTAGRRGGASQQGDRTVRPARSFPAPPKTFKTNFVNVSVESLTNEIICKAANELNPRLSNGLYAVDTWFIRETTAALRYWLRIRLTPFWLYDPFQAKHIRENKTRRSTHQYSGTKSDRRPVNKSQISRGSIADSTRIYFFHWFTYIFPDMPYMKRVRRDK